ncbi:hypothetical protein PsB1_0785 [Candidatus Phycosocius spiralis]|uniref:Uncharacterized protein n=1 Tax=Candidatus Phycosocius spiralis TaxID=2815099 RepID=A0ABQ4PUH1_9PROT|nr:hypothetical protein PsB1_0785 [Candidatus Phycosocius spiralis]
MTSPQANDSKVDICLYGYCSITPSGMAISKSNALKHLNLIVLLLGLFRAILMPDRVDWATDLVERSKFDPPKAWPIF